MKKNSIIFIRVFVCIMIVIIACSISFAVFTNTYMGEKTQSITTANLVLDLDDTASSGINILSAIPVKDSTGLNYTPYTFTVKNNGTIPANYTIKIIDNDTMYSNDGCSSKKLAWSNVKYSFSKNGGTNTIGLLGATGGMFETGTIAKGVTNTYTLRLWINEDATNEIMGQHFHGLIQLDATQ